MNAGDVFTEVDSQVMPPDGEYILTSIKVEKTDLFLNGELHRSEFDHDDYDGFQTGLLDGMKKVGLGNLPPIIAVPENNVYVVVDGHHRLICAVELGQKEINAYLRRG